MQPPESMIPPAPMSMDQYGNLQNIFGNAFDPSQHEPQRDFEVIPPCKPVCMIEKAEVKATKKGTGHYVKLEMKILEGPYTGRKLFDQINIDNPDSQCVEIGLRVLSALGRAAKTGPINDTAQLLGKVVVPHVFVKNDPTYGAQNAIRTYSAPDEIQGQASGLPSPASLPTSPAPAPAAAPAPSAAPPSLFEPPARPVNPPWARPTA